MLKVGINLRVHFQHLHGSLMYLTHQIRSTYPQVGRDRDQESTGTQYLF